MLVKKTNNNSFSQLEDICQEISIFFEDLLENKIVNKELAAPINLKGIYNTKDARAEYVRRLDIWDKKIHGPRALAAKYWLLFAMFFVMLSKEIIYKKDDENFFLSIYFTFCMTLLLAGIMKLYQAIFSSIPFQSIGTFFLNNNERRLCNLEHRMSKVYRQAERAGPLSVWRFLSGDRELEEAIQEGGMDYYEHNAMLHGLFSVKNKVFDCVAISALVILKLIEKQIPLPIERISKFGQYKDVHSYVIVNRKYGNLRDINTWNDDCMIIDFWYEIYTSIKVLKSNPSFFLQYPLLDPADKTVTQKIMGNDPPKGYKIYLKKFQELLHEHNKIHDSHNINSMNF